MAVQFQGHPMLSAGLITSCSVTDLARHAYDPPGAPAGAATHFLHPALQPFIPAGSGCLGASPSWKPSSPRQQSEPRLQSSSWRQCSRRRKRSCSSCGRRRRHSWQRRARRRRRRGSRGSSGRRGEAGMGAVRLWHCRAGTMDGCSATFPDWEEGMAGGGPFHAPTYGFDTSTCCSARSPCPPSCRHAAIPVPARMTCTLCGRCLERWYSAPHHFYLSPTCPPVNMPLAPQGECGSALIGYRAGSRAAGSAGRGHRPPADRSSRWAAGGEGSSCWHLHITTNKCHATLQPWIARFACVAS